MNEYVVGFCFFGNDDILLINKMKPDVLKGLYNGIGGKVEEGENPKVAMAREFREETAINNYASEWTKFLILDIPNYGEIHFFKWFSMVKWTLKPPADPLAIKYTPKGADGEFPRWTSWEDEILTGKIPIVSNLFWILPLAQDRSAKMTTTYLRRENV